MLQTLLGANVGALLKTKMGHQKVSDKQQSFLMAKFRIGEKADRNFDAKKVAREMRRAQDPDDMRSLNSLQLLRRLIVFLSFKYRLCSKVILRRCMFRPLKRRAILVPRKLLFFSRQSAAVRQMIVRGSLFRHLKKTNFCQTKEATEITHLQHQYPFVYDQLALCVLAMEGTLKYLKLHMLQ